MSDHKISLLPRIATKKRMRCFPRRLLLSACLLVLSHAKEVGPESMSSKLNKNDPTSQKSSNRISTLLKSKKYLDDKFLNPKSESNKIFGGNDNAAIRSDAKKEIEFGRFVTSQSNKNILKPINTNGNVYNENDPSIASLSISNLETPSHSASKRNKLRIDNDLRILQEDSSAPSSRKKRYKRIVTRRKKKVVKKRVKKQVVYKKRKPKNKKIKPPTKGRKRNNS